MENGWYTFGREHFRVRLMIDIPEGESLLIPIDSFAGATVDLAVLLAWHGLALCDRTTAQNAQQADVICAAEREARRYQRGIHDGGFASHDRERLTLIDIGHLGESAGGGQYSASGGAGMSSGGGWWNQHSQLKALRHDPRVTIRDYGSSMGLPPDSSRAGH
jgi:hypothetical protein